MNIRCSKINISGIVSLREQFLEEQNMQIRYDSCHYRGWADEYLIETDNEKVGYGSVKGKNELDERDAIFEFYLLPSYRNKSSAVFSELVKITKANWVECQSNDFLLSSMCFEFCTGIHSDAILFDDHKETKYVLPDITFSLWNGVSVIEGMKKSDMGRFVLKREKEILATAGFLTHYNFPYADLYMEVKKEHWGKGYGSFILQEVKKECYKSERVPAARCNISNPASKATLLKAGMNICGYMLTGAITR